MSPEIMMTIGDAQDALDNMVSQFHNEMLRRGIKEMPPRRWAAEFQFWLDPWELERQYSDTLRAISGKRSYRK